MIGVNAMKPNPGFTLVEMMVAILILAILMALAVPSFQTFIQNAQIRTAAESMQAGMHLARTEALRRNTRVTLWLVNGLTGACARSNVGVSWVISLDDPAGACNAGASESAAPRLIQSRSGNDGSASVNVSALSAAPAAASSCITFNGFGRVEPACTGGGAPIASVGFVSATAPATTRPLALRAVAGGAIRTCEPLASTGSAVAC